MNTIPIQPFKAEYEVTDEAGRKSWSPCMVYGIEVERMCHGHFVGTVEDSDGRLWPYAFDSVRRVA